MFNSMMGGFPSLADIAAVTKNNDGDGWGGGFGAWWVIIILAFLWGGYGNGGLFGGGRGAGAAYPVEAEVQRGFDTQSIISKLDGINNGLCSLGYDQLVQMNGINQNITQTGYTLQGAVQAQTIAQMQDTNALSRQIGDCCCENRASIAQVRYDNATNTCSITTAIANAARDIVDNANANYRALHEENVQARLEAKDETIAALRQSLNDCGRRTDNQALGAYIVDQLKQPCPVPAYSVPNPNWPWAYNYNVLPFINNGGCGGCNGYGQFVA